MNTLQNSNPSKLHAQAFGLPACSTCPVRGQICLVCYSHYGMGRMKNVLSVLERNKRLILSQSVDESVSQLVSSLERQEYYRWFWSGDIWCPKMYQVMVETVVNTPNTLHWITTRTENTMKGPNVVTRKSIYQMNATSEHMESFETTCLSPKYVNKDPSIIECPGDCFKCGRLCWSSFSGNIAYRYHGSAFGVKRYQSLVKQGVLPE